MINLRNIFSSTLRIAALFILLSSLALGACKKDDDPTPPSRTTANRELARAFYEDAFNASTPASRETVLKKIVSANYIQHNAIVPPGRDGLLAFENSLSASFNDYKATIREIIATEDRVICRWTFTGTLTGQPFLGIAASGQQLEMDVIDIWTVKDGQLYEHWDELNWTRTLVKLGVTGLPAPFVQTANLPYNR